MSVTARQTDICLCRLLVWSNWPLFRYQDPIEDSVHKPKGLKQVPKFTTGRTAFLWNDPNLIYKSNKYFARHVKTCLARCQLRSHLCKGQQNDEDAHYSVCSLLFESDIETLISEGLAILIWLLRSPLSIYSCHIVLRTVYNWLVRYSKKLLKMSSAYLHLSLSYTYTQTSQNCRNSLSTLVTILDCSVIWKQCLMCYDNILIVWISNIVMAHCSYETKIPKGIKPKIIKRLDHVYYPGSIRVNTRNFKRLDKASVALKNR
jgi:hypothetical protein